MGHAMKKLIDFYVDREIGWLELGDFGCGSRMRRWLPRIDVDCSRIGRGCSLV